MHDIDFTAPITDWDQEPMIRPGEIEPSQVCPSCGARFPAHRAAKTITLAWISLHVLSQMYPDEQNLDPEVKLDRYRLALRIADGGPTIALSAEQVTILKDLIGKHWSPRVMGQAWELLDPGCVLGKGVAE